ncbi:MAG: hypothetical protein ACQUHE_12525, partial [Bacteroidia bacterium]
MITLLTYSFLAFGQKNPLIREKDYFEIPNSGGKFVEISDSSKYLRFDGFNIVDARRATPVQLKRIAQRERIVKLQEGRFWGLTTLSDRYPFPRQSIGLRFEQNTDARIYDGLRWKWGTLYRNTIIIDGKSDVEVIDGLILP